MNAKNIAIVVSFFLLVILYVVEIEVFSHYLELGRFFGYAIIMGVILSAILLTWQLREFEGKSISKAQLALGIIIGCLVLSPLLFSWTNRIFHPVESTEVEFVKEEGRFQGAVIDPKQKHRADHYQLYFYWNHRPYRITTNESYFPKTLEGEKIQIPLNNGRWGFALVQY